MSEELYVLALLCLSGYPVEAEYAKTLDSLFLQSDRDDDLLYLESERDMKKAMLSIMARFRMENADKKTLWHCLKARLKPFYKREDPSAFANKLYEIWKLLPDEISLEKPFHMMSYIDEPLSWSDVDACRRLCEELLAYEL